MEISMIEKEKDTSSEKKISVIKPMFTVNYNEFLLDGKVLVKAKNDNAVIIADLIQDSHFINESDRSRYLFMFDKEDVDMDFHREMVDSFKEYVDEDGWLSLKHHDVEFKLDEIKGAVVVEVIGYVMSNIYHYKDKTSIEVCILGED